MSTTPLTRRNGAKGLASHVLKGAQTEWKKATVQQEKQLTTA
jgi:hypothetical protein